MDTNTLTSERNAIVAEMTERMVSDSMYTLSADYRSASVRLAEIDDELGL